MRYLIGFLAFATIAVLAAFMMPGSVNASLQKEFRKKFAEFLVPIPPIDYPRVLGGQPNEELLQLGRELFNDVILSRNNDVSCATCHLSNHGFADGNSLSFGALGKGGAHGENVGRHFAEGKIDNRTCDEDNWGFRCSGPMFRNSLSTVNVAYRASPREDQGLLWDGRFGRLAFQVLLPIHTQEELCGSNPVPQKDNPFREGGPLFKDPVLINHSHLNDPYTGQDFNRFNAPKQKVLGVPSRRQSGQQSVPNRNECLAIAIAKIRYSETYQRLFLRAFGEEGVSDIKVGRALAAFISTHVSKDSPWDRMIAHRGGLSEAQIYGAAIFLSPPGASVTLGDKTLKGAGCVECHSPPHFGGKSFASLGIVSDPRSVLSKPSVVFTRNSFFVEPKGDRGQLARCHIQDISTRGSDYAPDIGRALATTSQKDCFQFRVPPLRNVIETFPYFHHGTARAQGLDSDDLKEKSLYALKQVIEFHLRGPVNVRQLNRQNPKNPFFDDLFQLDPFVPTEYTQFSTSEGAGFPVDLSDQEKDWLLEFVAQGLYDPSATSRGDLGNDVSHPTHSASGLNPTITRDHGHQRELPE